MLQPTCLSRLLLFFLLLLGIQSSAQEKTFLLAKKEGNNTLTLLGVGAVVKFQYLGYSKHVQEYKGRITRIDNDSLYMEDLKLRHPSSFSIAVSDVVGFRSYSNARTISKSILELGLAGANLGLYYGVLAPSAIATGPAILISVGTGVASYFIVKALYPEKVKNTIHNGWSFKVIRRST